MGGAKKKLGQIFKMLDILITAISSVTYRLKKPIFKKKNEAVKLPKFRLGTIPRQTFDYFVYN